MSAANAQFVDLQLVPTHDAEMVAALLKSAGFSHARQQQPAYLRWLCSHPDTPQELLFTLAQFPELRTELGHRTEPWALLEMLAEAYEQEEAILTLGNAYYSQDHFPFAEFGDFLRRHGGHEWLLASLCGTKPSSIEKEQLLREAAARSPQRDALLESLDLRHQCEQARELTDSTELTRLHHLRQPAIWLALAQNRASPLTVLAELASLRDVPRAAEIRRSAQDTLALRK